MDKITNWEIFLTNIEEHIPGNRGEQLLNFYKRYEERVILMPAAHKKEYTKTQQALLGSPSVLNSFFRLLRASISVGSLKVL